MPGFVQTPPTPRSLLDELENSPHARVINLSSSVYTTGKFDEANLQSERCFTTLGSYAASKLLVLLFTGELANRLAGTPITANAAHPGIVRTHMMLGAPGLFRAVSYAALPFSLSAQQGGRDLGIPRVLSRSGRYLREILFAWRAEARQDQTQHTSQSRPAVGPEYGDATARFNEVAEFVACPAAGAAGCASQAGSGPDTPRQSFASVASRSQSAEQ